MEFFYGLCSLLKLGAVLTGATSTPPTGGIAFRVGPRTGSVGKTAMTHGSFLTLRFGYQLSGMRQIMRRIERVSTGAKTEAIVPAVLASMSAMPSARCR